MKTYEILKMHIALQAIAQRLFPAAISFRMSINAKRIEPFVAAYHTALRKIIDQHAVKEDGKPKFLSGGIPIWADAKGEVELIALSSATEKIDLLKIPISVLEKENFAWPVLSHLLPMIDELG
jgi:hypothetical protein